MVRARTGPEPVCGSDGAGGGGSAGAGGPAPGHREAGGPAQTMFAADAASRGLGIELVEAADGAARLRMTVTPAMVNGHGIAHGGYLFLFADTAFACACNSRGPVTVAAGADITFTAPVHEGDELVAEARERTLFGRSGIYDVSVLRGETVVAEFRGRSRAVRGGGTEQT
ncbi:hydroxyphenylacetyl-CoA thioesterase PaaI [Streptomyces lycii]|uniref:Hydroxyphenylacetyl-CoA thioesterase PaaI n=2 Tax=Streptomyces TaxID=1883 RepID=A0ABQ7FFB4_9ACTN|nr:hydroxyphenylacetyl-CoA thioesterase PaaI [Streptomyces lycii]